MAIDWYHNDTLEGAGQQVMQHPLALSQQVNLWRKPMQHSTNITFKVDGRKVSEAKARATYIERDPTCSMPAHRAHSSEVFTQACEQSHIGETARFWVEQEGVTIRHANEEA